jgi:hypothetical protein
VDGFHSLIFPFKELKETPQKTFAMQIFFVVGWRLWIRHLSRKQFKKPVAAAR